MRDKIYVAVLSFAFIILLMWCPGASLLAKAGVIKLPESKNVKLPDKVYTDGQLLSPLLNSIERGKANIENIYANCLPAYERITIMMLDGERSMRESLIDVLYRIEGEEPVSPTDGEEDTAPRIQYQAKQIGTDGQNKVWAITEVGKPYSEGWTDKTLLAREEELRHRIEIQLGHVNRIANANLSVNFYVFPCTRFQETEVFDDIIRDIRVMRNEFSTYNLMMEFFDGLDMSAVNGYDYFKIDTLEKRLSRIFKTDHHETARGAYSIYCDVINMIAKDSPEIGEPYTLNKWNWFPDVELRGSHVWGHGYTEISDIFEDYDIDLPRHTMYTSLDGGGTTARNFDAYVNGYHDKSIFADHYGAYYPRPARITYPSNRTGRNLLMLADSYSWATAELIAANFDNTYVTLWTHGEFNYNEFIDRNNITDVLIMQVADRLLYDIQNDTQLGRVRTDR